MILILTNRSDSHADHFIKIAASEDVKIFRLNTEDILAGYKIKLCHNSNGLSGHIEDITGRKFDLSERAAAWYRKPSLDFRGAGASDVYTTFVRAETRALLDILLLSPNINWVNDPFSADRSKSKIQQLEFARRCGVKTPDTVISNVPKDLEDFFLDSGENAITKAIYSANVDINGINAGIPTTKVTAADLLERGGQIKFCPTQFQRNIRKSFEVRATVVSDQVFAVAIDSQWHEETRVDWRLRAELCEHKIHALPACIERFCVDLIAHFGLEYGAIDLIVDQSGDYVFLENNPFGQYLWIERDTGLQITRAILNLLRQKEEGAKPGL